MTEKLETVKGNKNEVSDLWMSSSLTSCLKLGELGG